MQQADVAAVSALEAAAHEFPWTAGHFSDSLRAGHAAWLLQSAGKLIGHAVYALLVDEAELLDIVVAPDWQQQGLGGQFMDFLMHEAQAAGAGKMFLEVRASNLAAQALYQRKGFQSVGLRRNYYPARQGREDALLMMKEL